MPCICAGKTLYEIDTKAAQIVKDLQGSFKASACLNETKEDYRNVFLSYSQQQQSIHGRKGQEILPRVLAAGNPFHYSALLDPFGAYFGKTSTGGTVLLDIFRKTNRRLSYDFLAVGKKGSGKSTLLKKIIEDRAIRGDFIRVFDVEGEFTMLTERLGGKVIYLTAAAIKSSTFCRCWPMTTARTLTMKLKLKPMASKSHLTTICQK